jgi:hypothetical protein
MKIRALEPSCVMRMDGRMDTTTLIVAFVNFGKARKNKKASAKCE